MVKGSALLKATKRWYKKAWVQWLLATVFFLSLGVAYMAPSMSSCSQTTPAFNSDSTGGIAWFQWASGNGLEWGHTSKSNYPIGENIDRPQFVTSEAFDIPYRLLATLTSPICGLNLMILLAYMSAALLMFGFMRWLLKRNSIALFAGYAAAFVPYHQAKSTSHIVYMYSVGFIAMLWAYLWFVRKPSYKRVSVVAVATALTMYLDGYFILIAAVLAASVFGFYVLSGITAVVRHKETVRQCLARFRYLLVFGLVVVTLLLPILYVQKTSQAQIKRSLSTARGDIKSDATSYAIRPVEFVLPYSTNPLLPDGYQKWRTAPQNIHNSNENENAMYVGVTVLILGGVAVGALGVKKVRTWKLASGDTYLSTTLLIVWALAICFACSLPYRVYLFGHVLHTPETLIVTLTHNWRVYARFFLVLDTLFIVLAALGLLVASKKLRPSRYFLVFALCFVLLFLEYLQPFGQYHGNLYTKSPTIYTRIKKDTSVRAIAEYPLLSLGYGPSVFTFQQLHGKSLINANDTAVQMSPTNQAISALGNPQTLGALKERGVSVVTSYGVDASNIPGLSPYANPDKSSNQVPTIYSYRIDKSVVPKKALLVPTKGFDQALTDGVAPSHHVIASTAELKIIPTLPGKKIDATYMVHFQASAYFTKTANITVSQDGKVLWSGEVGKQTPVDFVADSGKPIVIVASAPVDLTYLDTSTVE